MLCCLLPHCNLLFFFNAAGEDGVEGAGPGTELQAEEGDCVDEDGPISPSERGCPPVAKESEEADGTEDDDSNQSPSTPPPSASLRLNPTALRDTGPPDRYGNSPAIRFSFFPLA